MKRRKASQEKSPLIRLVGLEALAVAAAAGMAGPPAMAAPGDLDPSFGDVGRVGLDVAGTLWSVEVQDDDAILFAGGYDYCSYYYGYVCDALDFTGRLFADGTPDAGFAVAALERTVVYDSALQADGKLVNVGLVRRPDGALKLQVFRLRPDGSLDQDFGLGGLVVVADATTSTEIGYSVLVEQDGHIVVAGTRGSKLLVARLQANGALDSTFGDGGAYTTDALPSGYALGGPMQVVRTSDGDYRVMMPVGTNDGVLHRRGCGVHGLTAAGELDGTFGSAGVVGPDNGLECSALTLDAAGRLLLAGTRSEVGGEVSRLLANGAADPAFQAATVSEQMRAVTALTLGAAGSIFVGGFDRSGESGATVMRLLADGAADPGYGRAGASTIELQSRRARFSTINDMQALDDDALVVGGGDYFIQSFVARLLGDSAAGGPGVLSMAQYRVIATEQSGQAVLKVRRSGGSTGAVAVTYRTRDTDSEGAAAGLDYTASTGRLTWPDGDASEREILVPVAADSTVENAEFFEVVLESPEGGAGLGAVGADVEIAGPSYPAGELRVERSRAAVFEGGRAGFSVIRDFYAQGTVSVTVRVAASSTATLGADFEWQDVVLTWGDGEAGSRSIEVRTLKDAIDDSNEVLILELVSPTGGALLSGASLATTVINDAPKPPPPAESRGGGSFGWLGAMLLGLAGFLRRRLTGNR
jgi:uncharacterized delta-60 repeat protein